MKILAYNIHRCNQEKIDSILQRGADIMVLPECACQDQVILPDGYEMTWVGQYDFKGLGVIWKSSVKCEVAPWADTEHKYMIPLIIDDEWLLLAAWPTIVPGIKKTYPQILLECLKAYSECIKEMPTMITGDFNCYIGQGGVSKQTDYLTAMVISADDSSRIKELVFGALTDDIDSRELFMKGIDYSYYYEQE